ncbi:MAG: hypothetical protein HKN94_13745 [Acidimicrobiales bacterium]|nr:glycine/betaine/sarcosine/D-proline family reductase selenoprotein B [Acidimicrobiia bacterium]NNC81203.1 hypothetical protein [Acidimicrobiales bacterium]RZV45172.1 MAG: hypothetical protein EX269_10625 [Acidimicrobiales bacterium]
MTKRISHRRYLSYIDKSREYYAAYGYEKPYQWASFDEVPFASMASPMSESRIGIVTTAFLPGTSRSNKPVYAHPVSETPDSMYTDDLSWDKDATHTSDLGTFLPLDHLHSFANDGRIGSVAPRFFGVPTQYSQRRTTIDAEQIATWCQEDDVDAIILIPL